MFCKSLVLFLYLFCFAVSAQQPNGALATAKGRTFTATDLSSEGQTAYANQQKAIEANRATLLGSMIADELLELEAKAANTTADKLIAAQTAKIADPTAAQIQAVYDANRAALGNRPLAEVRKDIVAYLRREPEQKAASDFIASLQAKYKFAPGKNINDADLKPFDVVASIGTRQISARDFETKNRIALNDFLHHQYEEIRSDLEIAVLNSLIGEEAKARNTDASSIIAAEVTDRMREFSDDERERLETDLMNRLCVKYEAKILLKEPEIVAQNVSPDDDPTRGPATAAVTVIMFSDFQCPACARTHPVLKRVIAEFGDKVRFVVRDYPLEGIHEDAFNAALAANAAHKQGKFMEYGELLYANQVSLDRASLIRFAGELGLNVKRFEIDLTDAKAAAEVRKDQADGELYGVSSTPTIFVNGVKVHSLSAAAFRRAITRALAK